MAEYILAVDLGTTVLKAGLFDGDFQLEEKYAVDIETHSPAENWREQSPEQWWNKLVEVVNGLISSASEEVEINCIGLTGQMHSPVLLDEQGKVLMNSLLWSDSRCTEELDHLRREKGNMIKDITGNSPVAAFTLPEILWVQKNRPDVLNETGNLVFPKDFLRYKLTGEIATDYTDASASMLFDLEAGKWSDSILNEFDLPVDILPPVHSSASISGRLSQAAARSLDLPSGIPVATGAGDLAATVTGMGLVCPGITGVNIGTAGQIMQPFSGELNLPDYFYVFLHPLSSSEYFALGSLFAAGRSLNWFKRELGRLEAEIADLTGVSAYEYLSTEAERSQPGANGLLFMPYLTGSSTPHQDSRDRGALVGLRDHHTKQDIVRAIMEGVTMEIRQIMDLYKAEGMNIKEIRIGGGASRSKFWQQLQADIYNSTVYPPVSRDASLLGSALLAGLAINIVNERGLTSEISLSAASKPGDEASLYDEIYSIYRDLWGSLHDINLRLDEL